MFRPVALLSTLAVAVASQAFAQTTEATPQVPAAQAPAPAKPSPIEEGDRLIAQARAEALFRNESKAEGPVVLRHTPSGLTCVFGVGKAVNAVVIPPTAAPGDDVACNTQTSVASHSFYATRLPAGLEIDEAFKLAVTALKMRSPDAKPHKRTDKAELMALLAPKMPPQRTAIFRIKEGFTRVSVIHLNGWELKGRMSSPIEPGVTSLADLSWIGAIAEAVVADKKAKEAKAPAAQ